MKKCYVLAVVLLIVFCSKKVTTVSETPQELPKEDKVLMVFKDEKPAQPLVETPKYLTVYFDFDSDVLRDNEKFKLSIIDKPVELTGGACPIGSDDYNYTLGLRRAYSVRDYLEQSGIKVTSVTSFGENGLVSTDKDEYPLNRRCEIKY